MQMMKRIHSSSYACEWMSLRESRSRGGEFYIRATDSGSFANDALGNYAGYRGWG